MGIIRKYSLLLMLLIVVSCGNRQLRETLDDVRNYISEHPDSALAVLEGVKADVGDSRRDRAEFALLYSMALDKNYIDLASDSVIAPAVSWYSRMVHLMTGLRCIITPGIYRIVITSSNYYGEGYFDVE